MIKKVKKEYIIMFFMVLILGYLFPYTGDDWAWGSSIGIERLVTWFDNYSGRYFGNLIVLVLTRFRFLKAIVVSVCVSGIVVLLDQLTCEKKYNFYFIVAILLLVPSVVLRQSIVWTAGFANYTTSIFLTLIYINYVKDMYEMEVLNYSNLNVIPLFILGVCNTLIVEHLTIYNVLLALYVIIFVYIKFKKVFVVHLSYLFGTVSGTVYMFSNSVYRSVSDGTDGYRTIGSENGIIYKAASTFVETISQEGFLNNVFLNICIFVVCFLVYKNIKNKLHENVKLLMKVSLLIIGCFSLYSIVNFQGEIIAFKYLDYIEACMTVLYILSIFTYILLLPITWDKKIKLAFIYGSIGFMMAPLLVVSPVGSRCFFATYVMFIYLVLELYQYVSQEDMKFVEKKMILLKGLIGVSIIFYYYIFTTIYIADVNRLEKAREDINAGKKVIEISNLPFSRFLWVADPFKDTVWEERYKLFYDIDQTIRIENIYSE